jgi:hypothetical protein
VVDTPDQVFVHTVEDLIYFSLTEIKHPLNLILKHQLVITLSSTILNLTRKGLTRIAQLRIQTTWRITMIIMKKWETHLKIMNHGWPEMLWKSSDGYITSLDIHKSYFPSLTLKPPDFLKTILKSSY